MLSWRVTSGCCRRLLPFFLVAVCCCRFFLSFLVPVCGCRFDNQMITARQPSDDQTITNRQPNYNQNRAAGWAAPPAPHQKTKTTARFLVQILETPRESRFPFPGNPGISVPRRKHFQRPSLDPPSNNRHLPRSHHL